jgi:Putative transposase
MTLHPHEFIRRFLIHVLPKGFHRIRHYGLFANGNRERRHSRIRTPPGIEHGDVGGLHTLASSADLEAAAQPGLDNCPAIHR